MEILIVKIGIAHRDKELQYNTQELGLAKALKKRGHSVNVLFFDKNVSCPEHSNYNPELTYLPCKKISNSAIINLNLYKMFPAKAIIITADNRLFLYRTVNWFITNAGIIPVCYFGSLFSNSSSYINKIVTYIALITNRSSLKQSQNVAKTNYIKQLLNEYAIETVDTIPVGLDDALLHNDSDNRIYYRQELGFDIKDIVLLFVGRMTNDKKPEFFIQLVEKALKDIPSIQAIMIGKGELLVKVRHLIEKSTARDKIKLIESVPYQDMHKYYLACDCFLNLSNKEIFGMAILESMYYGCAVVSHIAPGPNDIIDDSVNGILCSSYDYDEWKSAITTALASNHIRTNAEKKVKEKFLWDRIAAKFEQILVN